MNQLQDFLAESLGAILSASPFFIALLLALAIPLFIIGLGLATKKLRLSTRLALILCAMVVGSTLNIALSGRVLHTEAEFALNPWLQYQDTPKIWGSLASQVCTAFVLALAGAEILRWATGQVRMQGRVQMVWLAALSYYFFSIVVSGVFGTFRNPRLNDLYGPVLITALALLAPGCDRRAWRWLRNALVLPSVGSLVAMVVFPKLALLPDYASIIPGISQRLYGLTDHANSLGIVAAAALMIELSPMVRTRPSIIIAACHLAALVLAQSKTAWIAALICILFVRWSWIKSRIFEGDGWRAAVGIGIALSFLLAIGIMVIGFGISFDKLTQSLSDSGVYTFTGRTEIWRVTLEEFFKSPVYGYGPSLWDMQFRIERGMLGAGQAHNQFIQTLGQSGGLGALSMLIYIAVLMYVVFKAWEASQGLAFVLLVLILVRCFSESPLRMASIMGWDNWLHYTLFVAAAASAAALKIDVQRRAANTRMASPSVL